MQIKVTRKELNNDNGDGGLEIIIPGTEANPQEKLECPVFIEEYEGELRVIIWNGEEDSQIIPLKIKKDSNRCSCGMDHTTFSSVIRTYTNKDPNGPEKYCRGHYEGDQFEADTEVNFGEGSFDLLDDSDTCIACNKLI